VHAGPCLVAVVGKGGVSQRGEEGIGLAQHLDQRGCRRNGFVPELH